MKRRNFLRLAAAAAVTPPEWLLAQSPAGLDLRHASVILVGKVDRGEKMAQVLVEEARKRCGIQWPIQRTATGKEQVVTSSPKIYLGTRGTGIESVRRLSLSSPRVIPAEGYLLRSGRDADGAWVAVMGADQRGLLFGIGKLLRLMQFGRQQARLPNGSLHLVSAPEYRLRGHQLGYRPKTNAYDAWTVAMWEQYIRDLALFGVNSIELLPPHTDDLPDSPHFTLPPKQMMIQMSCIADDYGLDVWVWYPAMAKDYSNPATVQKSVDDWAQIFSVLPRLNAVFVPGGDPGHTAPKYLMALLEKQKASLRRYHPKAQVWVSPQGFGRDWMNEFLEITRQPHTMSWLDGVVFGPLSRLTVQQLREALPAHYPIRCYPDITHSVQCEYPVPDWDLAYQLTEGREVTNPRPRGEATILRQIMPGTLGFIAYSEGCNDDVNKFVWSGLAWDSKQDVRDVLREYSRFFLGWRLEEEFSQGLMALEENWRGPLMTNAGVDVTLQRCVDMEQSCTPEVRENWRFQEMLYRAYYDAFVRQRLLDETAHVVRARDILSRTAEIGWGAVPLGVGGKPAALPPNGLLPDPLLDEAEAVLNQVIQNPASQRLRTRVKELSEALFQSIHMQLAVERYDAEAVSRAANLDTLDAPVCDAMWMRRQIQEIRAISDSMKQISAIHDLLFRTDPEPGGFYDELGDPCNRPHLVIPDEHNPDPDFRYTPMIGCNYPDRWQDRVPRAWKHWAGALYDASLRMRYAGLDNPTGYRLRVVYSGDSPHIKIRLMANDAVQIHSYILRTWPPAPQEFAIPPEATAAGKLELAWNREPGLGGNGHGCEVAEVWLIPNPPRETV